MSIIAAGDGMTDAEKGQFKALGAEEDNSSPEKDVVKERTHFKDIQRFKFFEDMSNCSNNQTINS